MTRFERDKFERFANCESHSYQKFSLFHYQTRLHKTKVDILKQDYDMI